MSRILFVGVFVCALGIGAASAQSRSEPTVSGYRTDMPAVNTPPPAADPNAGNQAARSAFARWNTAQSRPRLLLFWNRELIEDAASQYDEVTTRGAVVAATRGAVVGASEQRSYKERSTDGRYGFSQDLFAKGVESSILSAFLSAGSRIVSREALIRQVSAKRSLDDRMDIQHLETLALGQGVQYLIEVLPDNDGASATGVSFTVKVTHLPSSTVRAQFVTTGEPPRGEAKFVAMAGRGFEKRAPEVDRAPTAIGTQIAYEIMSRLR